MKTASPLSVNDLTVAWHRKPVIWDVDLEVPSGQLDRKSTRLNSSHG